MDYKLKLKDVDYILHDGEIAYIMISSDTHYFFSYINQLGLRGYISKEEYKLYKRNYIEFCKIKLIKDIIYSPLGED